MTAGQASGQSAVLPRHRGHFYFAKQGTFLFGVDTRFFLYGMAFSRKGTGREEQKESLLNVTFKMAARLGGIGKAGGFDQT